MDPRSKEAMNWDKDSRFFEGHSHSCIQFLELHPYKAADHIISACFDPDRKLKVPCPDPSTHSRKSPIGNKIARWRT